MRRLIRLPNRFPEATKYVVEAHGPLVRRYIEFPDGRKLELEPRKALTCRCQAARELKPQKPARFAA
jgi:hypothetical protein